jgi:lysophospholipid acyltransferase (LPLAT)-like uncharacterized protein
MLHKMCHNQSKNQSVLIIPALRQLTSDGFRFLQETIESRLECERSAKEVSFVLHFWHPDTVCLPLTWLSSETCSVPTRAVRKRGPKYPIGLEHQRLNIRPEI